MVLKQVATLQFQALNLENFSKFRELAPEMDIVITTALIPNREAPKLWLTIW